MHSAFINICERMSHSLNLKGGSVKRCHNKTVCEGSHLVLNPQPTVSGGR